MVEENRLTPKQSTIRGGRRENKCMKVVVCFPLKLTCRRMLSKEVIQEDHGGNAEQSEGKTAI